jgi:AraC-like DNA-binding protein
VRSTSTGRGSRNRQAIAPAARAELVATQGEPRRALTARGESEPVTLTYALQDYAANDTDESLTAEVEAFVPLGDPCHYRVHVSPTYGSGHSEFCGIADGFFVYFTDMEFGSPCAMSVSAPNFLRIRVASDGDGEYTPTRGEPLDIKGPGASIVVEPAGVPPADAVFAGRNKAVHIYVHREAMKLLYAQKEQELPAVLQAFIAGNLQRTVARRLPFGPGLLRCLDDMQGSTLEGRGRRLFIQSKAVEILCHAFDALAQEEKHASADASALTTRGVLKAQRLLMENFVTPPSLDDLAHQVGLSRSGLCAGFREVVGQTVFDYIADLRMQHALALLNERNTSITQIAYAVGYTHPSSFSVAVQRRFGTTPSALRRQGLPIV